MQLEMEMEATVRREAAIYMYIMQLYYIVTVYIEQAIGIYTNRGYIVTV